MTSRTLGGLVATSDRQQRVWELHLVDSTIRCWGRNIAGQLGNGTTADSSTSVAVSGITTATQVAAGNGFSCARLTDSSVKCWGGNGFGNLGNGTTTPSTTPVTVSGITTATQVTAGSGHACAVLSDRTVRCWGNNSQGQLGDGTTQNRLTPVAVQGITTAVEVGAGNIHTCARLENETAKCWGDNFWGQLGDGTQTDQLTPVSVPGIATATQVEAGDLHSCARLANATVTCWGELQLTPTVVPGITTASQASAGAAHSCARLADSTARCWGPNDYGQLGNGTFTASSIPVVVSGINTATQVSAGLVAGYGPHTCARLSDSTVRCWGNAYYGQLGNGVFGYSLVPVAVAIGGARPTFARYHDDEPRRRDSRSGVLAVRDRDEWHDAVQLDDLGGSATTRTQPDADRNAERHASGTPATAGSYSFTVRVTDSAVSPRLTRRPSRSPSRLRPGTAAAQSAVARQLQSLSRESGVARRQLGTGRDPRRAGRAAFPEPPSQLPVARGWILVSRDSVPCR